MGKQQYVESIVVSFNVLRRFIRFIRSHSGATMTSGPRWPGRAESFLKKNYSLILTPNLQRHALWQNYLPSIAIISIGLTGGRYNCRQPHWVLPLSVSIST